MFSRPYVYVAVLAIIAGGAVGGCGDSSEQTEPANAGSTTERADVYAKGKSGGETLGCSNASPGEEARRTPGCIYAAAFTGCLAALEGEPREEMKDEADLPELQDVYDAAYKDCSTD